MVKLQRHLAYKYKDKEHFKNVITLSDQVIDKLGWKEGIELEPIIEKGKLVLKEKKGKRYG